MENVAPTSVCTRTDEYLNPWRRKEWMRTKDATATFTQHKM
jgi:hypothetical protein